MIDIKAILKELQSHLHFPNLETSIAFVLAMILRTVLLLW